MVLLYVYAVRRLSKVCREVSDLSRLRLKIMRIKIDLAKYLLQTLNILTKLNVRT